MKNNNKLAITIAAMCLIGSAPVQAQTYEEYLEAENKKFSEFVQKDEHEFKAYRDKVNAEFADFMRNAWTKFESAPAEPLPKRPEPLEPVVVSPNVKPSSDPIPFEIVIAPLKPIVVAPPKPIIVVPPKPKEVTPPKPKEVTPPSKPTFKFQYYGTECAVEIDNSHRFKLKSTKEKDVAVAWNTLSEEKYDNIITSCLMWRDKLRLSDWGYASFVEDMTESYFGLKQKNEAKVMQMFILTQSGYKVRIARSKDRLVLLLPFDASIYEYSFIRIGGDMYYVIDNTKEGKNSYYVFDHKFPNEQILSLSINKEPLLANKPTKPRIFASKRYPNAVAEVYTNQNLIDLYNDFPLNNGWDIYSKASLSDGAKQMLYPALRKSIQGKTDIESANILLNFVQTAFEYKTDEEQFGRERPLFADESLYYPYNDCEDRSIIYSILIQDLIGLDIVLLNYPGHLATAVCFGNSAKGDYVILDGSRYLICDPTYIGATVGMTMPNYKKSKATVVRL